MRPDITARRSWDEQLLACPGQARGRALTAIGPAPGRTRTRLAAGGVAGLVDAALVLSREADAAKPDASG